MAVLSGLVLFGSANASKATPAPPAVQHPDVRLGDDSTCLACHQQPDLATELPSGETLGLSIDPDAWWASTHGTERMACVQCHSDITQVPHQVTDAEDLRDVAISGSETCIECHQQQAGAEADSVHAAARAAGKKEAAVCSDCHDPHTTTEMAVPRAEIPKTCQTCHAGIYDEYVKSVHGAALIDGNPDVPTCTDCHGVHNVEGPDYQASFRLFSPQICATCHADKELMDKYDISTDVFDTYVADFHGTTVVLFEKIAPDQQTNKPVCVDCHGVHNIRPASDPTSTVYQANLLKTCQRCHPDATTNFPSSWLGHYRPDIHRYPLVFFVKLFYMIVIPVVLGAMALFVAIDVYGRRRTRRQQHG